VEIGSGGAVFGGFAQVEGVDKILGWIAGVACALIPAKACGESGVDAGQISDNIFTLG
jgi:hypothetical protein